MTDPLPFSTDNVVRMAVLGMIEGNGHPYSWAAIVNGFDDRAIAACPYPVITQYLSAQPPGTVGIPGAHVTHVWTDSPEDAPLVATASQIPHVLAKPEDAIGKVDAVLIATDDGFDHVRRARPFVEAGLPVFVDKPLALTRDDLATFARWVDSGALILSSSALRYAPELDSLIRDRSSLGELRWISSLTCKSWERYGVHALEPVYRVLGPGFVSVRLEARYDVEVAHLCHQSGVEVSLPVVPDGAPLFGTLHFCGNRGQSIIRLTDTYSAFRRQLMEFISAVRNGRQPYPFPETLEISAVLIAGLVSRQESSRRVTVAEVRSEILP